MPTNNNEQKKLDFSHLLLTIGGAMIGSWWVKNEIEEWKKSRAEKDDPQSVEEVCIEIAELLEQWQPDEGCESEDDFTKSLVNYLDENSNWKLRFIQKHLKDSLIF